MPAACRDTRREGNNRILCLKLLPERWKVQVCYFQLLTGPSNEEKEMIKNGYENLFSQSFVYGYITSFSNLIFRWGKLDEPDFEENNPDYNFPEDTTEIFTKINRIKVKLFNKLFKLSYCFLAMKKWE